MAQDIQRQLEEVEVKIREFEEQGVYLEQLIRGEIPNETAPSTPINGINDADCTHTALFKQWFNVMRQLSELKQREKELVVQTHELELDDQHARLQQDLHFRLQSANGE